MQHQSGDEEELRQLLVKGGLAHGIPLQHITQLKLPNQHLRSLPTALWQLVSLEELDLGSNLLESLPDSIGNLTRLGLLNLMGNRLRHLPHTIGALTALHTLGLKSNALESLPEEIGGLVRLQSLFLTDNRLVSLPRSIGGLIALRKLQAAQNRLASLPDSISCLTSLELFRMPSNQLTALPPAVFHMPRLCWFSISANPVCPSPPTVQLPCVPLASLQLNTTLGAGASGTVYDTEWQARRVAAKLFKSDVSPDGPCTEEVRVACALDHPNVPKVHALLEGGKGLIMSLIHAAPLADRPNASSFLRSRYPATASFAPALGRAVVSGIAQALQYLHSQGICHGDVYAHNVLVSTDATKPFAWLCDFGAAFTYTRGSTVGTVSFEALEVRAFGLLLEEMRQRTQLSAEEAARWAALAARCVDAAPSRRPSFHAIAAELNE